jgi:hypothetical protein
MCLIDYRKNNDTKQRYQLTNIQIGTTNVCLYSLARFTDILWITANKKSVALALRWITWWIQMWNRGLSCSGIKVNLLLVSKISPKPNISHPTAVKVLAGTALAFLGGAALVMPRLAGAAVLPGARVLLGGRGTQVVKQKIGVRN